jgi:hypothetical protein
VFPVLPAVKTAGYYQKPLRGYGSLRDFVPARYAAKRKQVSPMRLAQSVTYAVSEYRTLALPNQDTAKFF